MAIGLSALGQYILVNCNDTECEAAIRAFPLTARSLPLSLPFLFVGWTFHAARDDRERLQAVLLLFLACAVFPIRQPGLIMIMAIGAGLLLLPITISLPGAAVRFSRRLAAATLFVYLIHNGILWVVKVQTPIHEWLGPTAAAIVVLPVCFLVGLGLDLTYRRFESLSLKALYACLPGRRALSPRGEEGPG